MARAWTLRYVVQKLEISLKEALEKAAPGSQISEYANTFYRTFHKPLTTEIYLAGNAMLPTLGQKTKGDSPASTLASMEKLIVRQLHDPSTESLFVGDVVAFTNPLEAAGAKKGGYLVRRIAACDGEEMVSSSPGEDSFTLEPGYCWVLADNMELPPSQARDSRLFGPVPMSSVLGRVVYYHRSATEHGMVQNSEPAHWMDEPVLQCELDPESI
mmetsp:Transcript_11755/g.33232  ORF Transcript_11755/g.33232 Transcript_11755/m.33232 type:complete len:214 (+) Transcript_11755:364-1005(+)